MKYPFLLFLFLQIIACTNPGSVENDNQADSQTQGDSMFIKVKGKTKVVTQTVKPRIPQRDIILNEAVTISNSFYNNLLSQNYPAAINFMHPDALSVTSKMEWINIFKSAQEKTGRLGFVKQIDHGARCQMEGGNGVGDYVELVFDAQYKDGNLREKLIFFRKDSTESVKILGYEYNAILERVTISGILNEK